MIPKLTSASLATLACVFALAGAFATAPAGAAVPTELSFVEAWDRLLQVSDELRAAEAEVRGQQQLAQAARKLRQPEIALDLRRLDYQKSLDVPLGPLGPLVAPIGIADPFEVQLDGWRTRPVVTASMPLYSGGQIPAARNAADAAVRGAQAGRHAAEESQAMLLARAYFGQQLAARAREVRADVRAGLERHLQRAEALEREGLISRAQRLQAQVARDEAEREYVRARNQLETAEILLATLLRSEPPVSLATPLFVLPRVAEHALGTPPADAHPRLRELYALADQSEAGIRVEEARFKPTVFAFGQYDLYRDDALFTEPDWIYGIGLRFTVLSNQGRRERLRAAREQAAQVQSGISETRVQLSILAARATRELDTTRAEFELLESALALAQENLRLQTIAFREGQATSLDVVDAELGLGRARVQRAQAAHDYVLALAQWLEASGQVNSLAGLVTHPERIVVE